jgi:hypothetical protein
MLFIFSTPVLIRHLWQLKAVVCLSWCLIRAVLLMHAVTAWTKIENANENQNSNNQFQLLWSIILSIIQAASDSQE